MYRKKDIEKIGGCGEREIVIVNLENLDIFSSFLLDMKSLDKLTFRNLSLASKKTKDVINNSAKELIKNQYKDNLLGCFPHLETFVTLSYSGFHENHLYNLSCIYEILLKQEIFYDSEPDAFGD